MSDPQPPDETGLSKRERQRQRRQAKQAQQARQQAADRRKRGVVVGVVALVVVAVVGGLAFRQVAQSRERAAAVAEAEDRYDEFGCTAPEEMPNLGNAHIGAAEELEASDPDTLYPDRPATSGTHLPVWAMTGVFDKAIDERLLVHNMEHGYTVLWYDTDAPSDEVDALMDWAQGQIDGPFPKIVVAEYPDDTLDGGLAITGWTHRQICERFDPTITLAFLDQHNGLESNAPEMTLQPHLEPGGGTIDPDATDGDLLFPPLGGAAVPGSGMEPGAVDDIDDEGQLEDDADQDAGDVEVEPTG